MRTLIVGESRNTDVHINDDLTRPTIVQGLKLDWIASPAPGVDRRMLFRVGGEVARATSIVRYAPGSAFARHTHGGGEEFLVLEGTFEDEFGAYPVGTYVRNPPESSHAPASRGGCVIFVRLWQFHEADRTQIVSRPTDGTPVATRPGAASALKLFEDRREQVQIEHWTPSSRVAVTNTDGLEFFVVSGNLAIDGYGEILDRHAWGRLPAGVGLSCRTGPRGAVIWMKHSPLHHLALTRAKPAQALDHSKAAPASATSEAS